MFWEEDFYKRLSELRIKKGVSARDMSLSIGQSEGYINNIENKKGYPSMLVFFYICEYLNVTPSEFFDDKNPDPQKLQEITAALKTLSDDQLKLISEMIKQMKK